MEKTSVKDDTLRLLHADEERDFIEDEIRFQKRLLIFGVLWTLALVGHFLLINALSDISESWQRVYGIFIVFWSMVSFCMLVGLGPCLYRIWTFLKYRKDLKNSLAKYGRTYRLIF